MSTYKLLIWGFELQFGLKKMPNQMMFTSKILIKYFCKMDYCNFAS